MLTQVQVIRILVAVNDCCNYRFQFSAILYVYIGQWKSISCFSSATYRKLVRELFIFHYFSILDKSGPFESKKLVFQFVVSLISKKTEQSKYLLKLIHPEFILGRFIQYVFILLCSVLNSNRTNFKAVMVSTCSKCKYYRELH